MQKLFKTDMLYADQTFETSSDLGLLSKQEILAFFDQVDWYEQAELADHEEFSPTLSVEDQDKKRLFWVAVIGNKTSIIFLVEADIDIELRKKFLGLFSYRSRVDSITKELNQQQARQFLELFMDQHDQRIYDLYIQKK